MNPLTSDGRVGPYLLVRELGRGAMATVFEARHADEGRRVAVKTMHAHLAKDAKAASRFLREARAAERIASDNVVRILDTGLHGELPYLVMELLDGVDLAAHMRARGPLPVREAASLLLPILAAVAKGHRAGIIHRDLKSSNVFVARRDGGKTTPILLDFGISKVEDDVELDVTASEVLLGTLHYMSPEQTRGGRNASTRSDQYSLGVMLYEMVTGKKPFAGSSPYALMHAIVSAKVLPPTMLQPSLPEEIDAIVLRAMHRDPERRYGSVEEVAAALSPWARDDSNLPARRASCRSTARRRGLATVAASALAGGMVLFAAHRPAKTAASVAPSLQEARVEVPPPSEPPPAPPPPTDQVAPPLPVATVTPPPRAPRPSGVPKATPPPRRTAVPAPSAAPSAAPERGTNGAFILE